jgi:hypothetical protein
MSEKVILLKFGLAKYSLTNCEKYKYPLKIRANFGLVAMHLRNLVSHHPRSIA